CYSYAGETPEAALDVSRVPLTMSPALEKATLDFVIHATVEKGNLLESYIFARILTAVFVQAMYAEKRGVAEQHDIDTALRYGVNYPRGPFEWMNGIGVPYVDAFIGALNDTVDDRRFARP
ncbi:MAG: hypothetical protein KC983_02440, partial [Phycisphaerales bacterium]|nr:hypothetical protein [Phycisphaerales bacterium]